MLKNIRKRKKKIRDNDGEILKNYPRLCQLAKIRGGLESGKNINVLSSRTHLNSKGFQKQNTEIVRYKSRKHCKYSSVQTGTI